MMSLASELRCGCEQWRDLWWPTVFPEAARITLVMTHCDGKIFCMVTVENMVGIMTCPFFLTRLPDTCLNSTQNYMRASICLQFLRTEAKSTSTPSWIRHRFSMFMHILIVYAYWIYIYICCICCINKHILHILHIFRSELSWTLCSCCRLQNMQDIWGCTRLFW